MAGPAALRLLALAAAALAAAAAAGGGGEGCAADAADGEGDGVGLLQPARAAAGRRGGDESACYDRLTKYCYVDSGEPECTPGGNLTWADMPQELANMGTMTVNGKKVDPPEPTVTETCTLDGKTCYVWTVDMPGMSKTDTFAPDCMSVADIIKESMKEEMTR